MATLINRTRKEYIALDSSMNLGPVLKLLFNTESEGENPWNFNDSIDLVDDLNLNPALLSGFTDIGTPTTPTYEAEDEVEELGDDDEVDTALCEGCGAEDSTAKMSHSGRVLCDSCSQVQEDQNPTCMSCATFVEVAGDLCEECHGHYREMMSEGMTAEAVGRSDQIDMEAVD